MTSLKEKYKDYFMIGAAVNSKTIETHADTILKHFNSITCENEMKYANVCKEKDKYNFAAADKIVDFAIKNKLALRGHTLVWHNQTPGWVFEGMDKQGLTERIRNHIASLGRKYQDHIYCWDVVNEAIEDKGELVFRKSGWSEILGKHFMEEVFEMAKELLPQSKLYYNDYNETDPIKREKIYETIKDMKERGIPIDGIGMQCHFNIYEPSEEELYRSIELYAGLGLHLQVTEMDVSMFRFEDHTSIDRPSEKMYEMQAEVFERSFRVFREYKDIIDCVTTWGVADDSTWLDNFPARNRKNWPLLFDEEHKPKEALLRILDF